MYKIMDDRSNIYLTFILFIVFIKFVFLIASFGNAYLSLFAKDKHVEVEAKFNYWKDRTEFIFVICMSALLLIMFYPRYKRAWPLNGEERFLLYLFGWILLFTADWSIFIGKASWYKYLAPFLSSHMKDKFEHEQKI